MKTQRIIGVILVSVLCQTCKPEEPALYNPSIKAVSFTGFSPENVVLNQTIRTITLTMPTTITNFKVKANVDLTPDTEIINGLLPDGTLDLSGYCPCSNVNITSDGQLAKTISLRNTVDNGTGTYLVLLNNKNPMVLKKGITPIEISFDQPTRVFLPAENYYGSQGIYGVSLAETGSNEYGFISADGGCMNICDGSDQHINQVGFSLDAYRPANLKPGLYDLRVALKDGTVLKYPQPIQVVP